ncbi:MAG: histidine ammonia-lyase [Candidatus Marinimicrobia bacterium]|nr:histidine ammonia-lyase [Candidatus Neomarinimicrobiota bacterium]|tara:strand:- start:10584 stop:12110 length:1527 start_codon:yes stop_codon:yes gene_type:complete
MVTLRISPKNYSIGDFAPLFSGPVRVSLTKNSIKNLNQSNRLMGKIIDSGKTVYGVNTGFGNLSHIHIEKKDQHALQLNLIRSHAAGVGNPLDHGLVRSIIVLKILTYVKGYSGVRLKLVEKMVQLLNKNIIPWIPGKGSVGASGDLAPLAHLALVIIGEGYVFYNGRKMRTESAFKKARISSLDLHPKEGLSLINGTQVSAAMAIKSMLKSYIFVQTADAIGALSVENSLSSRKVFHKNIHELKAHNGQQKAARNVFNLLRGSEIVNSHSQCDRVQDPYSFRCIPHIHGACRDSISGAEFIINNEINSVSDNPLILKNGNVVNSGHFHAEHLAQAMDILAISFAELGAISERRSYYFMKGIPDKIPPFIAANPGLESGYMMAHVTASSLVSENKTLAHPASVDSIPTSGGQEDLVSMAPWAGQKLFQIQKNLEIIFAVELLIATAANQSAFKNLNPGKGTKPIINLVCSLCDFDSGDHILSNEILILSEKIGNGEIVSFLNKFIKLD